MSALPVSLIVLVCMFAATLIGMAAARRLPHHHLDSNSKDVIKLATAVVGTLAALALALLVGSAKVTYDNANAELRTSMARVVLLDREMARYGAETNGARAHLRTLVEARLSEAFTGTASVTNEKASIEPVQADLRALSPDTNAQRLVPVGDNRSVCIAPARVSMRIRTSVDVAQDRGPRRQGRCARADGVTDGNDDWASLPGLQSRRRSVARGT